MTDTVSIERDDLNTTITPGNGQVEKFIHFGNTGLKVYAFPDNWQLHFTPKADLNGMPMETKVIGKEREFILKLSLGIDELLRFWRDTSNFNTEFPRRDKAYWGTKEESMCNHLKVLFSKIEQLTGRTILEEYYTETITINDMNETWHYGYLHLDVLNEVVAELESSLSMEELSKIKYFQRLYQAKSILQTRDVN